jgi:hypothetical protein
MEPAQPVALTTPAIVPRVHTHAHPLLRTIKQVHGGQVLGTASSSESRDKRVKCGMTSRPSAAAVRGVGGRSSGGGQQAQPWRGALSGAHTLRSGPPTCLLHRAAAHLFFILRKFSQTLPGPHSLAPCTNCFGAAPTGPHAPAPSPPPALPTRALPALLALPVPLLPPSSLYLSPSSPPAPSSPRPRPPPARVLRQKKQPARRPLEPSARRGRHKAAPCPRRPRGTR